jgi:hypothetical protein
MTTLKNGAELESYRASSRKLHFWSIKRTRTAPLMHRKNLSRNPHYHPEPWSLSSNSSIGSFQAHWCEIPCFARSSWLMQQRIRRNDSFPTFFGIDASLPMQSNALWSIKRRQRAPLMGVFPPRFGSFRRRSLPGRPIARWPTRACPGSPPPSP